MRILKDKDYQLLEELISLSEDNLSRIMKKYLEKHYKKVTATIDYIYAEGDIPIALVAHMDTVFLSPPEAVFYDRQKGAIFGSHGLGADDRAGIWLILQIIRSGLRPHVILTTEEETGCVGASMLAKDHPKHPFGDLRYLIQLDRRGKSDCVFYDCENPEFEEYVEQFGFITAIGSFTDISVICPQWEIAGVNLSVGYVNEHTQSELLFVQPLLSTLEKVKKMLMEKDIPNFKYIPSPYSYLSNWNYCDYFSSPSSKKVIKSEYQVQCAHCENIVIDLDTLPVKKRGGGTVFYCSDCISKNEDIDWCLNCGEAYQLDPSEEHSIYCEDCKKAKAKVEVKNV